MKSYHLVQLWSLLPITLQSITFVTLTTESVQSYLRIEVHILKARHHILIIFIGFSLISISSGNKRITAVYVFIYRETHAPRPKCFKMLTSYNSLHSDYYLGDTAMFLILSFLLICPLSCKSASSSDSVLQNRKHKLLYEQLKVVKIW